MADIKTYTDQIANAVYGEEVRSSIINALNKVNDDNNSYAQIKSDVVAAKDDVTAQVNAFDQIKSDYVVDKSQFPLFRLRPDMQSVRAMWYWLRDIVSAAYFAGVADSGICSARNASDSNGVRPAFCIYQP